MRVLKLLCKPCGSEAKLLQSRPARLASVWNRAGTSWSPARVPISGRWTSATATTQPSYTYSKEQSAALARVFSTMGSEPQHDLAFLRVTKAEVIAYLATIENTAENGLKLFVRDPQSIANTKTFPVSEITTSAPVFDYTQQLILFAAYGKYLTDDEYEKNKTIDLWRVGPHFSLVSVDHVQPLRSASRHQPGLVVRGDLISIGVEALPESDRRADAFPLIAQNVPNPDGSDWTTVQYNTNTKETFGQNTRIFQSTDPDIKYVYHMKIDETKNTTRSDHVILEQMRANEFEKLSTAKKSLWTSYEIDCGWEALYNGVPAYAFTHGLSSTPTKRRLYLFQLVWLENLIDVAYVNLRPDGSINSAKSLIQAVHEEQIAFTPHPKSFCEGLHAVDLADGRIMLVWAERVENVTTPRAIVMSVDQDGALVRPWKEVEVQWDTKVTDQEHYLSWSAVLVPRDFVAV